MSPDIAVSLPLALLYALAVVHTGAASAQAYPFKPLRLVVPFAPGGISDILARILADRLAESLAQPVIVENRAGAGGNTGTELVARATPDGYTLLFCAPSFAISPSLYRKLGYDPDRDFAAVAQVASATNLLAVNSAVPARTTKQLIALAQSKPGAINYGSGGSGTSGQLAAELFKISANVNVVHVPYKGAGPAVTALLGNEVQLMFAPLPLILPHVASGKLQPLAVTSITRSRAAPTIPTIAETGIPGFDVTSWFGVLAPAATPKNIINRLHSEIDKALALVDVRDRMASQGADPRIRAPDEFEKYILAETRKWSDVIRRAGITTD